MHRLRSAPSKHLNHDVDVIRVIVAGCIGALRSNPKTKYLRLLLLMNFTFLATNWKDDVWDGVRNGSVYSLSLNSTFERQALRINFIASQLFVIDKWLNNEKRLVIHLFHLLRRCIKSSLIKFKEFIFQFVQIYVESSKILLEMPSAIAFYAFHIFNLWPLWLNFAEQDDPYGKKILIGRIL